MEKTENIGGCNEKWFSNWYRDDRFGGAMWVVGLTMNVAWVCQTAGTLIGSGISLAGICYLGLKEMEKRDKSKS